MVCTSIDEIGRRLVSCRLNCDGIQNKPRKGILPRCLLLENPNNLKEPDCIIVGINPGISNEREREYYKNNGPSYDALKRYFFDYGKICKRKYYEKLRGFAKEIGFGNAILWTDLCKCENRTKRKPPPLQTFRTCVKHFLQGELDLFPGAPIIAVGNQAFQALSYMFPLRFIIGVPHPTGSYGNFSQLFKKGRLKAKYKEMAKMNKDKHGNANSVKLFPS